MLMVLTVNQRVAGSSPAGGASRGWFTHQPFLFYVLYLHLIRFWNSKRKYL